MVLISGPMFFAGPHSPFKSSSLKYISSPPNPVSLDLTKNKCLPSVLKLTEDSLYFVLMFLFSLFGLPQSKPNKLLSYKSPPSSPLAL